MWKLGLCPHFDLRVTPRVTSIVPVEAMLPAWIPGSVLQSHSDFALDLVVSRVPWPPPLVHVLILRVFGSHRDPADLSRSAGRACGGDQGSQKRRRPPGLPRPRRDDLPAQSRPNQEPSSPEGTFRSPFTRGAGGLPASCPIPGIRACSLSHNGLLS